MPYKTKPRLLFIYKYLIDHTDPEHSITGVQLNAELDRLYGLKATRNTISNDLKMLEESRLGIAHFRSSHNLYYFDGHNFDEAELKILIDAVASAKFITSRKSKSLINKLSRLAGEHAAKKLVRNVYADGRVKSANEKGYYIVDRINEAINTNKKIRFYYAKYDINKHRVKANDGKPYTVSPYSLIWDGDYYYMRGYCDERSDMRNFRIDRIYGVPDILDDDTVTKPVDYDPSIYQRAVFAMFDNDEKPVKVKLYCEAKLMNYLIDEFGENIKVKLDPDEKHFTARVEVSPGPTFYRWVFGFSGDIKILTPKPVREKYREMCRNGLRSDGF